jgi:signal transduction histidine kinase
MTSRRRFLVHLSLIVPPVVVLSAVALFSLRQDRALIERDARDHARMLAPELARQCGTRVGEELAGFLQREAAEISGESKPPSGFLSASEAWPQSQCLIVDGQIQVPTDYPRLPVPANWPEELTHDQARWWRIADKALFQDRDPIAAWKALTALRGYKSTPASAANAEFNLLLLESRRGVYTTLAARFVDLAGRNPNVLTRSGAFLADLALLQAWKQPAGGNVLQLFALLAQRVIKSPSFLTPALLESAGRLVSDSGGTGEAPALLKTLTKYSLRRSKALNLLPILLQRLPNPSLSSQIWLDSEDQRFLALCSPVSAKASEEAQKTHTAWHVTFVPEKLVADTLRNTLLSTPGQLPAYAAAIVQIGDRGWRISGKSQKVEPIGDRHDSDLAAASGQLGVKPDLTSLTPNPWFLKEGSWKISLMSNPEERQRIISGRVRLEADLCLHPFALRLELASPDLLYARYRQRMWFAAGLILLAVAAAFIGILSAWRTFQQQLRLNEMTSNFVSSVSHELRAPIASMRLMAESLAGGRIADGGRQREYFRLIVQECRRLAGLIENVLDFSRMRQGRKQYEFEPIHLAQLVRETIQVMEPYAGERQVCLTSLEHAPDDDRLQPSWDGRAIQQALVNLIDNAIKHSPEGTAVRVGIEIPDGRAETAPATPGKSPAVIRLWVEDQGRGVPAEDRDRIFEAFYRRGSELRRETGGIGIGLSIVKHVAEAHGGRAFVDRSDEHGSRFALELPYTAVAPRPSTARHGR